MGKLTINLCEELHQRIREDVAADESLTTGLLMERIIRAHYEGPKPRPRIESGGRTMAFSVSEELFQRVKRYLAAHGGQSQRDFVIGLVTQGLALWEQGKSLKMLEGYTPQKGDRTLAFAVTEELFQQIKSYLAAHKKLSQKEFMVSLVENAVSAWEAGAEADGSPMVGVLPELTEEEKSEWAMDIAYDMDEFFRQHDPQYAAEHPEEHAAKEEIYENLMAGRISALDEKLAALGQTQEDYLPSEIEKFKDATGYEEFLDVDPQVIREAIENPDQSHVDEMLAFAEQANREYEAEVYGQQAAPTPDDRETGETVRTPRGTFHVTDMSRKQMEAAGYGFHHESEDGKYLIMANGSRAFAIPSGAAPEHTSPGKMTVLVVEPMKEPYVKEIDPGLHALQAEVGGDIAASYPFDDPVGLVLNDEGKLIGLDLNRSLRDEHGEIYDIVAGTFLVVGLGEESFSSLPPELAQKYMEHFKQPEQFINLNGQIIALPVEPENPLRTAEMTLEDDYGMIDGVINNGRRGKELEKAQDEARRTTPEKKPSIRERLEDAKWECGERKSPDKAHQKKPPEHDL